MTFSKIDSTQPNLEGQKDGSANNSSFRPRFNSTSTSDRLREGYKMPYVSMASKNIKKGRKSVFKEVGLADESSSSASCSSESFDEREFGEITGLRSQRNSSAGLAPEDEERATRVVTRWLSKLSPSKRPKTHIPAASVAPVRRFSVQHLSMIVLIIAIALPAISYTQSGRQVAGLAQAVPLEPRADSPTSVCTRWAHQGEDSLPSSGSTCQ
jgi:hypothetical protein